MIAKWGDNWWVTDAEEEQYQQWLLYESFYDTHGRHASTISKNPEEKRFARWLQNRKTVLRGQTKGDYCYPKTKAAMTAKWGEGWWDLEEQQFKQWLTYEAFYDTHGRHASTFYPKEERLARWIGSRKKALKGQGQGTCHPKVKTATIAKWGEGWWNERQTQPRKRSNPSSSPSECPNAQKRQCSLLEQYHQKFKTMRSETYVQHVQAHREEWQAYHDVAKSHDARDPEEARPLSRIAGMLERRPDLHNKRAIDLGCGLNELRRLAPTFKWTSVDAVAVDSTVQEADVCHLPYEEEYFRLAILSRALWAVNKHDVLDEVARILMPQGTLIVCEAFNRWHDVETQENRLLTLLESHGFQVQQHVATPGDIFQFVTCRKTNNVHYYEHVEAMAT